MLVNPAILLNLLFAYSAFGGSEEEQGVKYANKCEGDFYLNLEQYFLKREI